MDNKYLENVLCELNPFFEENSFKEVDGNFTNDNKSVSVKYDDARQMFVLSVADVTEGNVGEFTEINAWLFDDTQNAKDATSVGIDFVNSLRKEMGIKRTRAVNAKIDLPTATKGDNMNISSFAKKMLDIFPALKEEYKNHIATYGNFLYLNFFGKHLIPRLVTLFEDGTKKQVKKFYIVAEDFYIKGDRDTVNTLIAVLTAASYKNQKVDEGIKEMLSENSHFQASYEAFKPAFAKNKKLLNAFNK